MNNKRRAHSCQEKRCRSKQFQFEIPLCMDHHQSHIEAITYDDSKRWSPGHLQFLNAANDEIVPFADIEPTIALGAGAFGTVYKAKIIKTEQVVAVKVVERDEDSKREVAILCTIAAAISSHPYHPAVSCFVRFYGHFNHLNQTFIIMELVGDGTLKQSTVAITGKLHYLLHIAHALEFLHQYCHIIHRDLKQDNVLIEQDQGKLTDFGLAAFVHRLDEMDHRLFYDCGTLEYKAPESFIANTMVTASSDTWSFGILLYKLLHPQDEFVFQYNFVDDEDRQEREFCKALHSQHVIPIARKYRAHRIHCNPHLSKKTYEFYMQIIDQCLAVTPRNRISLTTIIALFTT